MTYSIKYSVYSREHIIICVIISSLVRAEITFVELEGILKMDLAVWHNLRPDQPTESFKPTLITCIGSDNYLTVYEP